MFHDTGGSKREDSKLYRKRYLSTEQANVDAEAVKAKVIEDINFLRARIAKTKHASFASGDPNILKTYESMLESREAVLVWLEDRSRRDNQGSSE